MCVFCNTLDISSRCKYYMESFSRLLSLNKTASIHTCDNFNVWQNSTFLCVIELCVMFLFHNFVKKILDYCKKLEKQASGVFPEATQCPFISLWQVISLDNILFVYSLTWWIRDTGDILPVPPGWGVTTKQNKVYLLYCGHWRLALIKKLKSS